MNWSEMQANWNELKSLVKGHWPELSDAVLDEVHGDRAELARAIQYRNGLSATMRKKRFVSLKRTCGDRVL
jgi:hypothetical protein